MEFRVTLILFGCILVVVNGYPQCTNQRECMRFNDCPEYQSYIGTDPYSWPEHVQNELRGLFCGFEHRRTGKIMFCCQPESDIIKADELNLKPSGRDLLDLEKCGKQSSSRISRGEIAEVFEFPWMALLGGREGKFHCGGSLIAESFVLTAAHCNRKKVTFVRVGETDLSTPRDCIYAEVGEECAEPYQDIPVTEFIRHENYTASKKKNDIALIKLAEPALLNDNVRPICLPLPELLPSRLPRKMTVSGWGFTEDQFEISSQLRYARVTVLEQDHCQRALSGFSDVLKLDNTHVCAGDENDLSDHCRGDSGGPLQYYGINGYVVHGVVSFGLGICGAERAPGVYTKVPQYVDWIIENLK